MMEFVYNKSTLMPLTEGEKNCFILANGLGGFSSLTHAGSVARGDHALLMAAVAAPNVRYHMITNVTEELIEESRTIPFFSQSFCCNKSIDNTAFIEKFQYETFPIWTYNINGKILEKRIIMLYGKNTVCVRYKYIKGDKSTELKVTPIYRMTPKNDAFVFDNSQCSSKSIFIDTNGFVYDTGILETDEMYFSQDERDGRNPKGTGFTDKFIVKTLNEGEEFYITFSTEAFSEENPGEYSRLLEMRKKHDDSVIKNSGISDETGKALVLASDAYIVKRDSVNGKTVIAGYPFFEDWGRDTFISLPGLTLATGRYDECKLILRTFAKYVKNGLMPNLFPEGGMTPMYNSVDAPLLFINVVYLYIKHTEDREFAHEMVPVIKKIINAYENGTDYHIKEDEDGLICAGADKEQLTWMDVCVDGFLPTPRHGKPVEINAYWYSALKVCGELSNDSYYAVKAERTKESFRNKFIDSENGCLKDVLNGTKEENQIRCNQIWALTQPFTMLTDREAGMVIGTVEKELYTSAGLRTLSIKDPDFKPVYIGTMQERDRAYHEGTVWAYPLGAFYRAKLSFARKENGDKRMKMLEEIYLQMSETRHWLKEGCTGHLAEIYDGLTPTVSRGCFAQAWSVAELLYAFKEYETVLKECE